MLKNLDPVLSPDLLQILRAMGHGDRIAIVDGNYPADNHAQRLVRLDGLSVTTVLDAILSVLPACRRSHGGHSLPPCWPIRLRPWDSIPKRRRRPRAN